MDNNIDRGVNGINTEISKIFGEEMAKLFSAQISDEELQTTAQAIWTQLNHKESYYGGFKDSIIENEIKTNLMERLREEIRKITETEEYKTSVRERAKTIVDNIIEETHRKMVEVVSNRFVALGTGDYTDGIEQFVRSEVYAVNNKNY